MLNNEIMLDESSIELSHWYELLADRPWFTNKNYWPHAYDSVFFARLLGWRYEQMAEARSFDKRHVFIVVRNNDKEKYRCFSIFDKEIVDGIKSKYCIVTCKNDDGKWFAVSRNRWHGAFGVDENETRAIYKLLLNANEKNNNMWNEIRYSNRNLTDKPKRKCSLSPK